MSLRNENIQVNQTEFIEQVSFLENRSHSFFSFSDLKKNKNLRPFYILFVLFFIIFLFFLFSVFFKNPPQQAVPFENTEKTIQLDPLSQRVQEMKQALKDHDPTKQSLPFPQVDLEFNIN